MSTVVTEHSTNAFDWYDALWLRAYFEAQGSSNAVRPAGSPISSKRCGCFAPIPRSKCAACPACSMPTDLAAIRQEIAAVPRENLEMHEMRQFGRFVVHDWPPFTRLQEELTGYVSELAGEDLEPNYNFLSLYTHRGVCAPHLDSPSAKWTLDICIDQSEPWPIHFSPILPWPERAEASSAGATSDGGLTFEEAVLLPGDAVLFSGSSQWHYRDALPATGKKSFCDLLFFHYIPAGTRDLLRPSGWAERFGVPELNEIAHIREGEY